jgi:hypothetical protein
MRCSLSIDISLSDEIARAKEIKATLLKLEAEKMKSMKRMKKTAMENEDVDAIIAESAKLEKCCSDVINELLLAFAINQSGDAENACILCGLSLSSTQ